jgi:hypothetical protein
MKTNFPTAVKSTAMISKILLLLGIIGDTVWRWKI